MQRKLTKTKVYYRLFTPSEKETSRKPLKVKAAKKVWISSLDTTFFNQFFLFHVITGRQKCLHKFLLVVDGVFYFF